MTVPTEDDVFLLLGQIVFEMQETEATLHLAMTVTMGIPVAKSVEQLRNLYAKKTIGQFLSLIRTKIGLSPAFDKFMNDYVERRNFAIHNFSRGSIFNVYSESGRVKLINFLTDLRYRNRKIRFTFVALTDAWMKILDPGYEPVITLRDIFGTNLYEEIVHEFGPTLNAIFGKSASRSSTYTSGSDS